jgi:DNA transformation protein
MTQALETLPNIGTVLAGRLRAAGIADAESFRTLGDEEAFVRLIRAFPEDACSHTRLALAGAARNVRWHGLDPALRSHLVKGLRAPRR